MWDILTYLCCNCFFFNHLWNVFYVGRRQFPVFTSAMESHSRSSLIEFVNLVILECELMLLFFLSICTKSWFTWLTFYNAFKSHTGMVLEIFTSRTERLFFSPCLFNFHVFLYRKYVNLWVVTILRSMRFFVIMFSYNNGRYLLFHDVVWAK